MENNIFINGTLIKLPLGDGEPKTPEEEFIKIFHNTKIVIVGKYIFFTKYDPRTKADQFVADIDPEVNTIYCASVTFWNIFIDKYQMNHSLIVSFLKGMFQQHFGLDLKPY